VASSPIRTKLIPQQICLARVPAVCGIKYWSCWGCWFADLAAVALASAVSLAGTFGAVSEVD
jgi:hypothetical protein